MRRPIAALAAVLIRGCSIAESPSAPPTSEPPATIEAGAITPQSMSPPDRPEIDTTQPTATAPWPRVVLRIEETAVVFTDELRLRSRPWVGEDSVRYVPTLDWGTRLRVLDAPVYASGYWWYRVRLLDGVALNDGIVEGWVASAAPDGCDWIGPEGAIDPCGGTRTVPPGFEPPVVLPVGDIVVARVDNVALRSEPWTGEDSVIYVPPLAAGTEMKVKSDAVYASGAWWYRIDLTNGVAVNGGITEGWVETIDRDGAERVGSPGCDIGPIDPTGPTLQPGDLPC